LVAPVLGIVAGSGQPPSEQDTARPGEMEPLRFGLRARRLPHDHRLLTRSPRMTERLRRQDESGVLARPTGQDAGVQRFDLGQPSLAGWCNLNVELHRHNADWTWQCADLTSAAHVFRVASTWTSDCWGGYPDRRYADAAPSI